MPFTRTGAAGLWVPGIPRSTGERHSSPFIIVAVGYSELFGREPSYDDVVARFQLYSLWQVLDVIGRASAVLERLPPWSTMKGQALLCDGILGRRCSEVRQALARWIRGLTEQERPERAVLFHELQLVTAAKIALLTLDPARESGESDFAALGEALLMVNDLLDSEIQRELNGADQGTAEGRQRWHRYLLTNGLFHAGDNTQHALARGHELYLTDRPHLRECGSYLDLPAVIHEITGLEPDLLWTVLFSLTAHWETLDPETVHKAPGAISLESYFTTKCNFSREESDRFFSLVADDARNVGEQLRAGGFEPGSLRPFDLLPLADKPLVVVDGRVYCVSVQLLLQKLTRGLHYLFLNRIPEKERRDLYLTYVGEVFDDYVTAALRRAFPALSQRYVDGPSLRDRTPHGSQVCDGAVIYPETVILVETKATLFTAAVRARGDWLQYEAKMRDIFIDAAGQFEDAVRQIEAGTFRELGLEPQRIRSYLPLVVTLEDIPMMKPIYDWVDGEIRDRGLLRHPKVRPLQAIDVSELEFLEVAVDQGRDVAALLEAKTSSDQTRHVSLGNYCLATGESFIHSINSYLAGRFEELAKRSVEIVRSRAKNQ